MTYVDLDSHTLQLPDDLIVANAIKRGLPPISVAIVEMRLAALLQEAGIELDKESMSNLGSSSDDSTNMSCPSPDQVEKDVGAVTLENDAVRDVMLNFMADVLDGYEKFLLLPSSNWRHDSSVWFDFEGFLAQVSMFCLYLT